MKKKEQNWMKLKDFCKKYKFVTQSGARTGYFKRKEQYTRTMCKVKNSWHINVNKYIRIMYKNYPEIDGVSERKNNIYSTAAKKIQNYLAKKPNDPIFVLLRQSQKNIERLAKNPIYVSQKKSQEIAKNCKNISMEEIQRITKKVLKKLPIEKKELERHLLADTIIWYLVDVIKEESFEGTSIILLETIEEYLMYLLKEMDKKSA